ncbi:hypothetical protein PSTG_05317 [Puccinia striiformis f. sp. tritici PST-78]|uniref:Uncharacterized protein n=1 Tax=Puccinia striiformis f. sp. tritici PST-78 TaxID=1165861 RepID=A0A0L0VQR6_9BASI|nr:hypothetical protein PSTG_05317 [Puccinia striiformis f. sp. tritici PST-78]
MASDREQPPHRSSCASSALGNQTDDDEPEPNTKANPSTPNSTQPSGATQALTNHEELLKAQKTAHNAVSACYLAYDSFLKYRRYPRLVPPVLPQGCGSGVWCLFWLKKPSGTRVPKYPGLDQHSLTGMLLDSSKKSSSIKYTDDWFQ